MQEAIITWTVTSLLLAIGFGIFGFILYMVT
jgi:hypothetical protein